MQSHAIHSRTLSENESRLLLAAASGEIFDCSSSSDKAIDGQVLRDLLIGAGPGRPLHPKGVRMRGVLIVGDVDLEHCKLERALSAEHCRFEGSVILTDAEVSTLTLSGCVLRRLQADRLKATGNLDLNGCEIAEGVHLRAAEIGDCLTLSGAHVLAPNLAQPQTAQDLEALALEGIKVDRNIYLSRGCRIEGQACLWGAKVTGDVVFNGGSFVNTQHPPGSPALPPVAIELHSAQVGGTLWLGPAEIAPDNRPVYIQGALDLRSARAGQLLDDHESWPAKGCLYLDGFTYGRFYGSAPTTARERLEWLNLQPKAYRSRPQPFEQLAQVFTSMGLDREAERISRQRHTRLLLRQLSENWLLAPWLLLKWVFLGLLMGFGYRPQRLIAVAALVWALTAALYHQAAEQAMFAPVNPVIYLDRAYESCRPEKGGSWVQCAIPELRNFSATQYSLDVLMAPLDLGLEEHWSPIRRAMAVEVPYLGRLPVGPDFMTSVVLAESVFGWILFVLLGAYLVGLLRNRRSLQ